MSWGYRSPKGEITSGRCVSAAKQHPHRPGIAPALGLRAGSNGLVIVSQTAFAEEPRSEALR
jgi:hypothetical protein